MNKFIKFLVSTTLIAASSAFAAPANYTFIAICDISRDVASALVSLNEVPIMMADHLEDEGHVIMVWLSEDGSMTITQTAENKTCVLAVGINSKVSKTLQDRNKSTQIKMLK